MTINMLAPAPFMQFQTAQGNAYTASATGIISNVNPADVANLLTYGCYELGGNNFSVLGGGSANAMQLSGHLNVQGGNPLAANAADTTDDVLATYTLPASFFDVAGRALDILAYGKTGATTNNKRVKLWINATIVTGVVTAGTVIADSGAWVNGTTPNNAVGWKLKATVEKYGAAGSNTQISIGEATIGATGLGAGVPTALTLTESGTIVLALTGSSYTTGAASDVLANLFEVIARN